MAFDLTNEALQAKDQLQIEPQLILEIEGVPTIYGTETIFQFIHIGDPGLYIDGSWVIGGYTENQDQSDNITFDGTTTTIAQQLNPDKANVQSISTMNVAFVDSQGEMTALISPGVVIEDLLYRRCKVWLGFKNTAFKDDFIVIFRGVIDTIKSDQGKVTLSISHPDQKKRQDIFQKAECKLNGSINSSTTTINVDTTDNFLTPVLGPSGANDTSLTFYIRIDDEIIKYTGKTGTSFTGVIRAGQVGNTDIPGNVAASHDDGATVSSFYRLQGNSIDLALKLMLSGFNDYFAEDVGVESFNRISATETVTNSIFFLGINLERDYNLSIGDYLTTSGSAFGANNVTLKQITDIVITDSGSYCVVDGVTFVYESDSAAICSFRSQYDTLGEGLKMYPDEVDIAQHLKIFRLFTSSLDYDFYLKDTINGQDFLNEQIYLPGAMYSVPRKAQSSVQYHIGPIPGSNTLTLNEDNILNPSKLSLGRSIGKNFYNTIVYKYDEDAIEDDKFLSGLIVTSATSKNRIPAGNRTLVIASKGMRTNLQAEVEIDSHANRKLRRYEFGAEYIDNVKLNFSDGFNVEIGDIVIVDATNLNISDTKTGERGMAPRFYEVVNKSFGIKGEISVNLTDTNFSTAARYALIGPESNIRTGISTTQFIIEESYNSPFGPNEYKKWDRYPGIQVKIRSPDSSVSETTFISNIQNNLITVSPALSFTPSTGYQLELSDYDGQTDQVHLLYGNMTDNPTFGDGTPFYSML